MHRQRPHREGGFDSPLGRWNMIEALPAPDLADSVSCYWEGWGDIQPLTEKILPRTELELMFNLRGRHRLMEVDGKPLGERYDGAWLSGLQRRWLLIETWEGSHFVAVRLKPWGAWRLLREPMSEVSCRVPLLDQLWGDAIHALEDQLAEAQDAFARFDLLEAFIRAKLDQRAAPSADVLGAVHHLHDSSGLQRIDTLCRELGTSRSTLARHFRDQVGLAPKTYARVVRVGAVMRHLATHGPDHWAMLAEDFGYHDQAHFIHEFQDFCGATPTEYMKRATPDGGATVEDPPTA